MKENIAKFLKKYEIWVHLALLVCVFISYLAGELYLAQFKYNINFIAAIFCMVMWYLHLTDFSSKNAHKLTFIGLFMLYFIPAYMYITATTVADAYYESNYTELLALADGDLAQLKKSDILMHFLRNLTSSGKI